ncbi:Uncharacterised protein [Salmonella enterica subsp. enterica serovar Typhi]|nr:Uncharacterised protein [Salmonella enterica subsp. enterica serovar Typhi]
MASDNTTSRAIPFTAGAVNNATQAVNCGWNPAIATSANCCWKAFTASRLSHMGFMSRAAYSNVSWLI